MVEREEPPPDERRPTDIPDFDLTRRDALRLGAGTIAASGIAIGTAGSTTATNATWLEPPATAGDIPNDEPIDRSRMTERRLDIADGDDLSARVAASESGDLLVVPEGTYRWTQPVAHGHSDWGLRGEWGGDVRVVVEDGWGLRGDPFLVNVEGGDNILIENLRIDTESPVGRATPGFRLKIPSAGLVHHVIWLHAGVRESHHATRSRILLHPTDPDGHVMIDGVVINNRGYVNYHNQGDRLAYSSAPGKLTFRNIKAGGFPDNIIYTRMPGEMVVENCVLANSTSFVRVGGDNETVRNCTCWVDTGRDVELHGLDGTSINMSPIVADNMSAASDGGYVEECSFVVREAPHASGVFRFLSNDWLEVRGCQVVMDTRAIPGTGQMGYGEEITLTDTDFVTTNSSGAAVAPSLEATYRTENVHVDEGLVPGHIEPDSRDPTFDWDLVHPFPEDGDFTLPGDPWGIAGGGIRRRTTFHEDHLGQPPAEWSPERGSSADVIAVVEEASATDGRLLEMAGAGSTLSWDAIGNDVAAVEVVARVRTTELDEDAEARLYVRAGAADDDRSGYVLGIGSDGARLVSQPTGEVMGSVDAVAADTWTWVLVRAQGNTLHVAIRETATWQFDEWDIEVEDESHASGWLGVGVAGGGAAQWDRLSVGTGGRRAPRPMITPAYVAVEELDAAREIPVGEPLEVTARVANAGDVPADGEIRYLVDNEVVEATEVTLAPGEGRTVAFAHSVPEPGTYLQRIETPHTSDGLALMVVDETDEEEPAGSDGREPTDAGDDNETADDDGGTAGTADGATVDDSPEDTSAIPGFGVGAALAGITAAASILNRRLRGDN